MLKNLWTWWLYVTNQNGPWAWASNFHHPAPWWYRVAARLFPDRCREIPEAQNPQRIVLRQVAIVKRYVYLQQFASGEDARWFHTHQWNRTIAIGLWGSYWEERLHPSHTIQRRVTAPYLYTMDATVAHHVLFPSPGHTSLFIGLWRNDDLKHYVTGWGGQVRHWADHIKVMVKRI